MITLPPVLAAYAERPRFVLWCLREIDGDMRKLPYGVNGAYGPVKAQCGTLREVIELWATLPSAFAGIGYIPSLFDDLACLDFDTLSEANPVAKSWWDGCRKTTYTEYSPSGKGGHALITLDHKAKKRLRGIRNVLDGMELYSDSGFFTITARTIDNRPVADLSDRMMNVADKLNLQPKDDIPSVEMSGRAVSRKEIGRVLEKISKWTTGEIYTALHEDLAKAARLAQAANWPRGKHGGLDRSTAMTRYVKCLIAAGATDADLLLTIVYESAIWREAYSYREHADDTLRDFVVAPLLAKVAKPKAEGIPLQFNPKDQP